MAVRVTATEVKVIIDTEMDDDDVDAFILAASLTIDELLGSSGLSTAQLKEIERWLSAHLIACKEGQVRVEQTGQAKAEYHGKTGYGLNFTSYGQQVLLLDTTGTLGKTIGKRLASIYAVTSFDYST